MPGRVTEDRHASPSRSPRAATAGAGDDPCPVRDGNDAGDAAAVCRLYTPPMIAAVLGVPPAAVRHWIRGCLLVATRRAASIEWFDFGQLVVGRGLARLLHAGLSLREIDSKLAGLAPGGAPEAARSADAIVTDGRRLSIRRAGRLVGAGGQLQLGFYAEGLAANHGHDRAATHAADRSTAPEPPVLDLATARFVEVAIPPRPRPGRAPAVSADGPRGRDACDVAELLDLADELEAAGEFAEAAEAVRAVLQLGGPTAPVLFMLAELLYRAGDLTAARERYYATIEIDPDHLQARASLGCVLADLGEQELALAALEGVLVQEPGYADAHWHMAGVLASRGELAEARDHLRAFLALAPDSPWARAARDRLEDLG